MPLRNTHGLKSGINGICIESDLKLCKKLPWNTRNIPYAGHGHEYPLGSSILGHLQALRKIGDRNNVSAEAHVP